MMKMRTNILLLLTASVVLMGCSRDEKSLFDDNADTRLNKALKNAENSFVNEENGWEMLYFPNTVSCGYNILVKFNPNGQAIVAACNSLTTRDRYVQDDNSTWTVKADYGPLLSFDTYNEVMHAWADPQTDGDGYLGDYEFLILNASNMSARLKGKKHKAYTQMFPLAKDLDWHNYFEQVQAYSNLLFTGNNGMPMTLKDHAHELKYIYQDGILQDPDSLGTLYFPLIVRPGCVQLYDNGLEGAIHFELNEAKDKLVCTDPGHEDACILPGFSPIQYFLYRFNQKNTNWVYESEGTSQEVVDALATIQADAQAKGATISRIALDRMRKNAMANDTITSLRISYLVDGKLFEGYIALGYEANNDYIRLSAGAADASLEPLLKRIAATSAQGAKRFTDIFCGSYAVESQSGSQFNMIHMNLLSTTVNGKKIHIIANNEMI